MRNFIQKGIILLLKIFRYKKILLVIIGAIAILAVFNLLKGEKVETNTAATVNGQRIQAPAAKATQEINQSFNFSIGNSKIGYTIENAQLQDEIIIKGQIAKSVIGKTFLVLNLKIRNDTKDIIEVSARDYIRLTANGNNNDKLALEIHNDPVLVQPISTKSTRLALPIKDADKNMVINVGEIEGEKRNIGINFEQ